MRGFISGKSGVIKIVKTTDSTIDKRLTNFNTSSAELGFILLYKSKVVISDIDINIEVKEEISRPFSKIRKNPLVPMLLIKYSTKTGEPMPGKPYTLNIVKITIDNKTRMIPVPYKAFVLFLLFRDNISC